MSGKKLPTTMAALGVAAAAACSAPVQTETSSGSPSPTYQSKPSARTPAPGIEPGSQVRVAGAPANHQGAEDVADQRVVYIEMEDYSFTPTVLTGEPGQRLRIEVENESQSPHTFTLGDGQADVVVEPGHTAQVRVLFPESGNVSFYSRFDQDRGMAGGLHVSGPVEKAGDRASFQW